MTFISSLLRRIKRALALIQRGYQPSIKQYLEKLQSAPVVHTGDAAGNEWDDYRVAIVEEFKLNPMSFLRQPVISRTVHPNQQSLAKAYLLDMTKDAFAREQILSRLHDIPIGDPYLCESFPLASPMSIQHAWYMLLMRKHLGMFLPHANLKHVLEFGGGYGNFCRLSCSFGYNGRYVIADLPEMHSIQSHFLTHAHPGRMTDNPVELRVLGDSKMLPVQGSSLFMATFSLNETLISLRSEVEPMFQYFDYLFFAYNRVFSGVDNVAYFDELSSRLSNQFEFTLVKDAYRPAWFLLGRRLVKTSN